MNLDIAMLVGGLPFNGNTLKEHSLGGSESAGLYMAKALAKRGHRVKVFCNTNDITEDETGAHYYPISLWTAYAKVTPHDVCIIQRAPEYFCHHYNSKLNLLWQHDLLLGRQMKDIKGVLWNVDRIMVLSEYHKQQYKDVSGLPDEVFWQTRNGIDLSLFDELRKEPISRNPKRLIYAARPERGLDVLLRDIMPKLLEQDPDIELCIAGYHNPVEHMQPFYELCKRLGEKLGDRVKWLGALTKEQLYREYMGAMVYVYPTPSAANPKFAEISCITAMECQAAGLPIVTSARGALPETIKAGTLIDGTPTDAEYVDKFCAEVMGYLTDGGKWEAANFAGRKHAQTLSWDALAADWSAEFERMIAAHNDSDERLFRHFWRQSDIVAAKAILDGPNSIPVDRKERLQEMLMPFDFAFKGREGFREQYAKIATTHGPDVFEYAKREQRLQEEIRWLRAHDEIKTILDYGCGTGGYPGLVAQAFPDRFVYGVDIDPATIEIGRKGCSEAGITNIQFQASEHDRLDVPQVDCAVLQEVLEHVAEPWEVLQNVERKVNPGGWVYITVPLGPWEYASYHTYPHRAHIWHFDYHDLLDMVGKKEGRTITTLYHADSAELGDPQGWWIVSYKADHAPIGKIDMERKRKLQRPRQTVSVAMIMGGENAEDNVHWCLKSIQHVADEIVIVDTGMSEEAKRQVLAHNVTLVRGPDPKREGFDVARNAALPLCGGDWIFWIDGDEKLINQRVVHKYLRENNYNGYGIRQHHFACDTTFSPDMPVRFFRNRPYKGKRMQFWGAIHEHPEIEVNEGPGPIIVMTDAHIAHVGYLNEDIRQRRFTRNYPLLQLDKQKYPDRILQKFFIMRDNMVLVREALKSTGGRMDPYIREKCQEVIDLYREHFLGKPLYANSDAAMHYSDALRVLGEGFEVSFAIGVDKANTPNIGDVAQYRFASRDDFIKELTRRVEEKIGALDSEMY